MQWYENGIEMRVCWHCFGMDVLAIARNKMVVGRGSIGSSKMGVVEFL